MGTNAIIAERTKGIEATGPTLLFCFVLILLQIVIVTGSFVAGYLLPDAGGQLPAVDFVNVWVAGNHALNGIPATAYNAVVHKAAEVAVLGHDFDDPLPWVYPPTFFFPAFVLAKLPYVQAYLIWMIVTFAAYLAVMRGIIGSNVSLFLACAYPGVMMNMIPGQNGFLTAALLGGALLTMQQRPLVSGVLLGLLSFKPQFGILIPIALVASSRWNVIGAAAVTTLATNAASLFVFGLAPWEAFFPALQVASQETLTEGLAGWGKLHSIYALVRVLGGSDTLGWTLYGSLLTVTAAAVFAIWRSKVSFEIKASALATGTLLATPYIFMYDLMILAVPMAFLLRAGARTGFLTGEILVMGTSSVLVLSFLVLTEPVGFAAILLVAALVARRMLAGVDPLLIGTLTPAMPAWAGSPKGPGS